MAQRVLEFESHQKLPRAFTLALGLIFKDDPLHEAIQEELGLTWHEAHDCLMELAFFLYLCYRHRGTAIAAPPRVDPVWHVFINRERDYRAYCHTCFGGLIEHKPYSEGVRKEIEVSETLARVDATFGSEFAKKWFGLAQCDGIFKAA